MNLKDFEIVKNRQAPEMCFAYEKYNSDKSEKYQLFTMDYGKTFLASITSRNNSGKLVDADYSEKFNSAEEGLQKIIEFIKKC